MDAFVLSFDESGRGIQKKIYDFLLSQNMETVLFSDYEDDENEVKYNNTIIKRISNKMTGIVSYGFKNLKVMIFVTDISSAITYIAPFIGESDEDSRPAILIIDKKERFVVPILSSNKMESVKFSINLAHDIDVAPILTETEKESVFSAIEWCRENKFNMFNVPILRDIYYAFLDGKNIGLYSEYEVVGEIPPNIDLITEQRRLEMILGNSNSGESKYEYGIYICSDQKNKIELPFMKTLVLEAKEFILGIGCKKNIAYENLIKAVEHAKIDINKIAAITTSNDLVDELAIQRLAKELKVNTFSYTDDELLSLNSTVYKTASAASGIMNICERSANTLSYLIDNNNFNLNVNLKNKKFRNILEGNNVLYTGEFHLKKTPYVGVNLSIIKRKIKINLYNY